MAALFKAAIAKPPRLLPEAEQRLPLFRADGRQHEACLIFLARGVSWRMARSLDSDCLSRHCGVLGPWASGWKPDLGAGPAQTIDGNKLRVCAGKVAGTVSAAKPRQEGVAENWVSYGMGS